MQSGADTGPTFQDKNGNRSLSKGSGSNKPNEKTGTFGTPKFDDVNQGSRGDLGPDGNVVYNTGSMDKTGEQHGVKKLGQVLSKQREYIEGLRAVIKDRENQLTELKDLTCLIQE